MGETAEENLVVEVLGSCEAEPMAEEVSAAYEVSFGAPPNYEGAEEFEHQGAAFAELRRRRGFRLAVARAKSRLVGFAYGAYLTPDTRWWEGMLEPLPEEMTAESGDRTFALVDMGVLPGNRCRGVGKALHDAVLGGCGAVRATLAVEPRLAANQRLYRSWGWRHVGRLTGAPGDIADAYDIYVLEDLPTGRP